MLAQPWHNCLLCVWLQVAENPAQEQRVCQNASSSVAAHPVEVRQGLLFVWGEAGALAALESQSRPVPVADIPGSIPEGVQALMHAQQGEGIGVRRGWAGGFAGSMQCRSERMPGAMQWPCSAGATGIMLTALLGAALLGLCFNNSVCKFLSCIPCC